MDFVIGSFPQEIQFTNKAGEKVTRKIDYHELTDILKAMSAPVRPYGAVFTFFGGALQSIRGNYQYFEMDQNHLGGVMNHSLMKQILVTTFIVFYAEK
jgi:hypothetical protein